MIQGAGAGLLLSYVAAFVWFRGASLDGFTTVDFLVGIGTVSPFVATLVYGGRWLARSDLSTDRFPRLVAWCAGGLAGFLGLNLVMILVWPTGATFDDVAWALFAASVGAAAGFGIGVFEARAIERAVAAEGHRVRREEAERRNERLEEFADLVAHDLRNPLTVATGRLTLAREGGDDEHLDAVGASLERIEAIVDGTLALARSGRVISDPSAVDLATTARESWENVATDNATLAVETTAAIEGDPDRLRHLFENCFRNSVEHSSTSPDSRARQDAVEHAGHGVTVTVGTTDDGFFVADDGPGIPPDEREPALASGYSTTGDGSGLGLAFVERIADAHGWTLSLTESAAGGLRVEFAGVFEPGAGESEPRDGERESRDGVTASRDGD